MRHENGQSNKLHTPPQYMHHFFKYTHTRVGDNAQREENKGSAEIETQFIYIYKKTHTLAPSI